MRYIRHIVAALIGGAGLACAAGVGGYVAVDQVGYTPTSTKYVFATAAADSFFVRDAATGTATFRGAFSLVTPADAATGKAVYRGDFSPLQTPGRWMIVTSHGDSSFSFTIADTVFNGVRRTALKGFYYQRCGMSLLPEFAGVYQHASCHPADAFFHATAESTGFSLVTGGWHDAGDYGKYVVNAGVSVGTLLMAYEEFPLKFADDGTGIPESGNGVPDLLDEVRYELAWLLKMQKSDGGIFFKVTKAQFEAFLMPQNDPLSPVRYIYEQSSCATGDFAAMMARAARLYRSHDSTFSDVCLAAARRAWGYLEAHPVIVPLGGFVNPPGTATGEYGDGSDTDERLWAAAELFETTGEKEFNQYYVQQAPGSGYITGPMSWGNVGALAHLTYLASAQPSADATVRSAVRQSLLGQCQYLLNSKRNSTGFQVALLPSEYVWGSNSGALNAAVLLLLGFRESGTQAYEDAAADQLHYVLGANALFRSFVTGLGARPPLHIHHRPSESDGIPEPVPGLLAGGPNRYGGDPVLNALIAAGTSPALCYADSTPSYASNEIAINWNAPLVFVAGYFGGTSGVSSAGGHGGMIPSQFRIEQNYPNPFNGGTRIGFELAERRDVDLHVVDLLGRLVYVGRMGALLPGRHEIRWDARDTLGRPVSSGTYFYFMTGTERSQVRRLLVVK